MTDYSPAYRQRADESELDFRKRILADDVAEFESCEQDPTDVEWVTLWRESAMMGIKSQLDKITRLELEQGANG